MAESSHKFSAKIARRLTVVSLLMILALGMTGVAVGFNLAGSKPLEAGLFFGVGSSLVGYVMTAGLHSWITEAANQHAVQTAIDVHVRDVLASVQQETYSLLATQFPQFVPKSYYPPSNAPSAEFDRELRTALLNSRKYYFRGVTARHVPVFLERSQPQNLQVSALLLHPSQREALSLYVMDRFGDGTQTTAERDRLIEKVTEEIYYAVVGLFDARHICPISIRTHRGPVFFRSEVFDESCFISFYVGGPRTSYPTTYVYGNHSFFYEAFYKDILHCLHSESPTIDLTPTTSEATLVQFLEQLGYAGEIEPLRSKFLAFRSSFK